MSRSGRQGERPGPRRHSPNEDELKRLYARRISLCSRPRPILRRRTRSAKPWQCVSPSSRPASGAGRGRAGRRIGFVVPPGNADLLAERITTLVHNPAMRRSSAIVAGDRRRTVNLTKTAGQIVTLLCAAADGAHVHGRRRRGVNANDERSPCQVKRRSLFREPSASFH